MRKTFLTFVLTLLAGVLFAQQPARVAVAEGTLEGINESGIKTFKGVPFAAPPVGDLRWKAPQPWRNGGACAKPKISVPTLCRRISSAT